MDKPDFYYRQLVSEGDMDNAFDKIEQAMYDMFVDAGLHGIMSGLSVAEEGVPSLSVIVSGPGTAYSQDGERMHVASDQEVDLSVDSNAVSTEVTTPGNSRIISLFIKPKRLLSNLKKDGNNVDVYYDVDESYEFVIVASAEALNPTPPALKSDAKLLADITRAHGQTTFVNANIELTDRRQTVFDVSANSLRVKAGTAEEAIEGVLSAVSAYAGGTTWFDGTTNPATTVELQLDKIITDLKGTAGSAKIGTALIDQTAPYQLAAGSVASQLAAMLALYKAHRIAAAVGEHLASAITNTPAGNIAATDVQAALNELDDEKGGLAESNIWTDGNLFSAGINLNSATSGTLTTFGANGPTYYGHTGGTLTDAQQITYHLRPLGGFGVNLNEPPVGDDELHFEVAAVGTPSTVVIESLSNGYVVRYMVEVVICRQGSYTNNHTATISGSFTRSSGGTSALVGSTVIDQHGAEGGVLGLALSSNQCVLTLSAPANAMNIHVYVHRRRCAVNAWA